MCLFFFQSCPGSENVDENCKLAQSDYLQFSSRRHYPCTPSYRYIFQETP